jgi:hypothetical protein
MSTASQISLMKQEGHVPNHIFLDKTVSFVVKSYYTSKPRRFWAMTIKVRGRLGLVRCKQPRPPRIEI